MWPMLHQVTPEEDNGEGGDAVGTMSGTLQYVH